MNKLRAMEVFATTADAGSFAAAAKRLDISAVMVGKHISALEASLGARLLARSTRRQSLTEIGAAYLDRCRDVLAAAHIAAGVADSLRATPQGTLRVTAPVAYGAYRLAPVIGDYLAAHPKVRIDLNLNDRVVDLAEEGFDCGIRSDLALAEGLIARPLPPLPMLAAVSALFLAQRGAPEHPSELAHWPILCLSAWGTAPVLKFSRGNETVVVNARGPLSANNGQALLSAAQAGAGVVVQSEALLGPALLAGQVVQLLPDWQLATRAMHIVRLPEARPSAKLRSFIDFVLARLG